MLLPSRIVAIDDKEEHLVGIKKAFTDLGCDCRTILYNDETIGEEPPLVGLRILFLDLNLQAVSSTGSDDNSRFSTIANLLIQLVNPNLGPYGLILWADEPKIDELMAFLKVRLKGPEIRHLPVFATALTKGEFITSNGEVLNPEVIKEAILTAVAKSPQLNALFAWEADGVAAMDATLRSVIDLVSQESKSLDEYNLELGKILYQLAVAGSGKERAKSNPRESINQVLVPVLADRISKHDPEASSSKIWTDAIVAVDDKPEDTLQTAINTALHVAAPVNSSDIIEKNSELGTAIVPKGDVEEAFMKIIGMKNKDALTNIVGITKREKQGQCRLSLIRIGALCDGAQTKDAMQTYILSVDSTIDGNFAYKQEKSGSGIDRWYSPRIQLPSNEGQSQIRAYLRYPINLPSSFLTDWEPVYRLRESLVVELTEKYARLVSRLGIVSVR